MTAVFESDRAAPTGGQEKDGREYITEGGCGVPGGAGSVRHDSCAQGCQGRVDGVGQEEGDCARIM